MQYYVKKNKGHTAHSTATHGSTEITDIQHAVSIQGINENFQKGKIRLELVPTKEKTGAETSELVPLFCKHELPWGGGGRKLLGLLETYCWIQLVEEMVLQKD
jgi:hypothetical protein